MESINIHLCVTVKLCFNIYLLKLLGDTKASVDPFPALCVFGLVVLQEVASGELSSYKFEQRKIYRNRDQKLNIYNLYFQKHTVWFNHGLWHQHYMIKNIGLSSCFIILPHVKAGRNRCLLPCPSSFDAFRLHICTLFLEHNGAAVGSIESQLVPSPAVSQHVWLQLLFSAEGL